MKLLDTLTVQSPSSTHTLELYHGDLSAMPAEHAVDLLVVSAYPNTYGTREGTLIASLKNVGVSVAKLAKNKFIDLREPFACWLSQEITEPMVPFKRILCFEPRVLGESSEIVGEIFQSLIPFVYGEPHIRSLAMPLVATGNQRFDVVDVMENLLEAVVNWFLLGLPVTTIKLVEYNELKAYEIKGIFSMLKRKYAQQTAVPNTTPEYRYDLFLSYSHQNRVEIDFIRAELLRLNPNIRLFFDQQNLDKGAAWQQELYEALDDCHRVLAILTPTYLTSKVCKEEFNIALARHRDTENVLIPLYLYSAELPTYMKLIQFLDCREFNKHKLTEACQQIVAGLG